MRILYISNSTALTGAPRALLNLVTALRTSHDVAVVLPERKGPLAKKLQNLGVKCYCEEAYRLTVYPKGVNIFKRRRRLAALKDDSALKAYIRYVIEDFSPDIVHTNVGPLDLALDICAELKIPHVWHLREYQDLDFKMKFYPSREAFAQKIHSEGNYNIAITHGIFEHFKLRVCDRIIYDGVFDVIPAPGEQPRENCFLYAARIEPAKGFSDLARAFREFIALRPDFKLVVAGRSCGLYGLRWKLYCKSKLPKGSVSFLGQVDDVYPLMAKAAATIVPSNFEAFGFTTAEAMLNGCVVIGRDAAGTKEQFDNGLRSQGREVGLRFSDRQSLLERMKFAASSSKELDSLRETARKYVVESYSSARCAAQVEAFYREILSK